MFTQAFNISQAQFSAFDWVQPYMLTLTQAVPHLGVISHSHYFDWAVLFCSSVHLGF